MSWPFKKYVWEGMREKERENFDGPFSGRDSNRALASLEGISETIKLIKDIHQD